MAGQEWTKKTLEAITALDPGEDDDDSIITPLLTALHTIFKKGLAEYHKTHLHYIKMNFRR